MKVKSNLCLGGNHCDNRVAFRVLTIKWSRRGDVVAKHTDLCNVHFDSGLAEAVATGARVQVRSL